ncbi:MAG: hypothetical protein ACKO1L_03660 [Brachymonas sp.]
MGNPQPGQGADIVEQMVAERTTPPQIPSEEPADIDALIADIEKSLSQGN